MRKDTPQPILPRFRPGSGRPGAWPVVGVAGYLPAEFLLAMPTNPIKPMTTTHTATGTEL